MPTRKPIISLAALLLSTAFAVSAARAGHEPLTTAKATQHQVNESGVTGQITITDSPAGPVYIGTASGLEPLAPLFRYITLVYETRSVPGGPIACEPNPTELPAMFVGTWLVDAEGNGTLIQLAPTEPLEAIDTISIRDNTINFGFGPEAVLACGQISVHPASP